MLCKGLIKGRTDKGKCLCKGRTNLRASSLWLLQPLQMCPSLLAFKSSRGKELARAGAGAGDCLCDDALLVSERSFKRREGAGRRRRRKKKRKKERKKERSCWLSIVPEMRISSGVVVYSTEQQRRKRLLLQVQLICLLLLVVLSSKVLVFFFFALIGRFFFPHPFVFWD